MNFLISREPVAEPQREKIPLKVFAVSDSSDARAERRARIIEAVDEQIADHKISLRRAEIAMAVVGAGCVATAIVRQFKVMIYTCLVPMAVLARYAWYQQLDLDALHRNYPVFDEPDSAPSSKPGA